MNITIKSGNFYLTMNKSNIEMGLATPLLYFAWFGFQLSSIDKQLLSHCSKTQLRNLERGFLTACFKVSHSLFCMQEYSVEDNNILVHKMIIYRVESTHDHFTFFKCKFLVFTV